MDKIAHVRFSSLSNFKDTMTFGREHKKIEISFQQFTIFV